MSPLPFAGWAGTSLTPLQIYNSSGLLSPHLSAAREANLFPELSETSLGQNPSALGAGAGTAACPRAVFANEVWPLRRDSKPVSQLRRALPSPPAGAGCVPDTAEDGVTCPIPSRVKRGESRPELLLACRILGSSGNGNGGSETPRGWGHGCATAAAPWTEPLAPARCSEKFAAYGKRSRKW